MTQSWFAVSALISIAFSGALSASTLYNDGPYLFYNNNKVERIDIVANKKTVSEYNGPLTITPTFNANRIDNFQGVEKIAAISDIHGQFDIFKTLLVNNKVIDQSLNWSFGKGHLVITGDIFDRGDTVTEALWLIYKLEQQALAAGGKLHYLLGNHEYMVLRDDQRYLHPKYVHAVSHFNNDLRQQYSNKSVLGRWLRSKSTIININGFIFLHGGIHQDFLDLKLSLEQANSEFRQTIGLGKKALKENPTWLTLHGSNGPIWYRGYFRDDALNDTQVDAVLSQLNAKKVIVGHTSMPTIETRFNSKIIAIDSSIKRGEKGEILLWQNGEFKRGLMSGEQKPLQ
ncbi:metallophosphoesterase [Pseudoalteromonas sp. T1lg24]|uniref:metallophosphoesterase n=1 Tax=Pseudoalteromonas sp. T1lg24 TaxID=2077099 RepID=UPI000CF60501|nr:metallophosphoesterase [Pseudoalteromonas sp. T1lg24]